MVLGQALKEQFIISRVGCSLLTRLSSRLPSPPQNTQLTHPMLPVQGTPRLLSTAFKASHEQTLPLPSATDPLLYLCWVLAILHPLLSHSVLLLRPPLLTRMSCIPFTHLFYE